MLTVLIIFHVLLCIALIFLVLLQQGKGADLGAVFGNSNSLFGTSSGDNIGKITTTLAIIFMITSILLVRAYIFQAKDPSYGRTQASNQVTAEQGMEDSVLNKIKVQDENNANIEQQASATETKTTK